MTIGNPYDELIVGIVHYSSMVRDEQLVEEGKMSSFEFYRRYPEAIPEFNPSDLFP